MEKQVTLSRSTLGALVLALVVCLVCIAFLLGRESRAPELRSEAPPVLVSVREQEVSELQAEQPLKLGEPVRQSPPARPVRLREPRIERRSTEPTAPPTRAARPVAPVPARPAAPPPARVQAQPKIVQAPVAKKQLASNDVAPPQQSQGNGAIRSYFQQIDASLQDTQSLGDPTAFATELLESSLSGDNSKLEDLASTANGSLAKVQALRPPASCAEHHKLLVKQLRQGAELLSQVGKATGNLDASSLGALSASGASMQAEAERLQQLERELRARI